MAVWDPRFKHQELQEVTAGNETERRAHLGTHVALQDAGLWAVLAGLWLTCVLDGGRRSQVCPRACFPALRNSPLQLSLEMGQGICFLSLH